MIKIRSKIVDDKKLFCLKDISKVLGSRDASVVSKHISNKYMSFHQFETNGGKQKLKMIDKNCLIKLLLKSRSDMVEKVINQLDIPLNIVFQ